MQTPVGGAQGVPHLQRPDHCAGITADDDRPGFAHERAIMLYTTSYLAGVMWLSLRFSPLYPASLVPLDNLLCAVSILSYLYGLVSPAATLVCLREQGCG